MRGRGGPIWLPLSQRARSDFTIIATTVPVGAAIGTLYDVFRGWPVSVAAAGGGMAGALMAGTLVAAQLGGVPGRLRRRLRRWPAIVHVTLMYVCALAAMLGAFAIGHLTGTLAAARSVPLTYVFDPGGVVLAGTVAGVLVAATALDRLVGSDVLVGIFTGRYLTPIQENRVFLFADLVGSTDLAERLGDLTFHQYLDELLSVLAACVRQNDGRIYRYVGDEIIVTWRIDGNIEQRAQQALACVNDCRRALRNKASYFERRFGARPEMRFALNAGPVVAGTMGDIKREVVFLGDTINTCAHLEDIAKTTGSGIVASDSVIRALSASESVKALKAPHVRGKRAPVQVYEVFERGP